MKKIFLDLGTHYGQGLKQFIQMYNIDKSWDIHTFEANPVTYKYFVNLNKNLIENLNLKHYNLAISHIDGEIAINMETPPNEPSTGMGSSIITLDKWNPWNDALRDNFKTSEIVKSINLSRFLDENFKKEDFILIKMDIEGAEYDVLEEMERNNTLQFVNDLYVEMHSHFFSNKQEMKEREKNIIQKIKDNNINFHLWH